MTIYVSSKTDLVALLSTAAGVTLTESEVDFTLPKVSSTNGKNTKVRATLGASSAYKGNQVLYYDRLELADLSNFSLVRVGIDLGITAHQALAKIKDVTGITFTTDDIEDTAVVEGSSTATLLVKAKANSLGWKGECTLTFNLYPLISTVFSSDLLPGF